MQVTIIIYLFISHMKCLWAERGAMRLCRLSVVIRGVGCNRPQKVTAGRRATNHTVFLYADYKYGFSSCFFLQRNFQTHTFYLRGF